MTNEKKHIRKYVPIKKVDTARQIVYAEVYAPNEIDAHGDMMLASSLEDMAHRYLMLDLSKTIDVNHSRNPIKAYPVESFIARNNPDYSEGAWVVATKIEDKDVWAKIENGELNGYSFDAYAMLLDAYATVEFYKNDYGYTEEANDHTHAYFLEYTKDGRILRGVTDTVNDHFHEIRYGTATETANDHSHRYFL